jgi:FtsZ-binding cell division protein ZapB
MSTKRTKEDQLALSGTEEGEILARLSERVERAIATIGDLRRERDTLQKRVADLEAQLADQTSAAERLTSLEEEHGRFQRERSEIRDRIESILSNLETLDAE